MKPKSIQIAALSATNETQSRCTLSPDVVKDYADRMAEGDKFPPVIVFEDGAIKDAPNMFLADGFHRVAAGVKNGFKDILAEVRNGTKLDALKYSLGANSTNGLHRTNADKRRCVSLALEFFGAMSDRALASMVGVSNQFVSNVRAEIAEATRPRQHVSTVDTSAATQPDTRTGDGKQCTAAAARPDEADQPGSEFETPEETPTEKPHIEIKQDSVELAGLKLLWKKTAQVDKIAFSQWAHL